MELGKIAANLVTSVASGQVGCYFFAVAIYTAQPWYAILNSICSGYL